jgi:hypothetical protein
VSDIAVRVCVECPSLGISPSYTRNTGHVLTARYQPAAGLLLTPDRPARSQVPDQSVQVTLYCSFHLITTTHSHSHHTICLFRYRTPPELEVLELEEAPQERDLSWFREMVAIERQRFSQTPTFVSSWLSVKDTRGKVWYVLCVLCEVHRTPVSYFFEFYTHTHTHYTLAGTMTS